MRYYVLFERRGKARGGGGGGMEGRGRDGREDEL
jgi:hypothetical protein